MKKSAVRVLSMILCGLLAVSLLAGCNGSPASNDPTEAPQNTPIPNGESTTMDIYGNGYNNLMLTGFDEYGRTITTAASERENKEIGIFYFLWLGTPFGKDIYDVSKIIKEYGKDVVFHQVDDKISPDGEPHWWGEPLYGYYNSADYYIIRKHLEMLTQAGIDFLIFDTTNTVLYDGVAKRIMKVITEMRAEGWDCPQVVFYTHSYAIETMQRIYNGFYKNNTYPDSWYLVDGKPMIIGYINEADDIKASGDKNYHPGNLPQNLQDFFYVREARWPGEPYNDNTWPYTEWEYPQPLNGDMINVSIATHPMVPFSFSLTHENWGNWGRGFDVVSRTNKSEDIYKGTFFESQWKTVYEQDPRFIMITGWNEWIAFKQWYGGEYMLCDNVDLEYSRDAEPMKGGYEDAYFIQMISAIRKYKYNSSDGYIADNVNKTIDINGADSQWDDVKAIYRKIDTKNDGRNFYGGSKVVHYDLEPNKNNILSVKVTDDKDNLYFRIECENNINVSHDSNYMNLFLGTGKCEQKGWESYEYVINRSRNATEAKIEKLAADYSGTDAGAAEYKENGKFMYFKIPKSAVGLANGGTFYFKVADGVAETAEIMDYYVTGSVLPMGRLAYEYKIK